MLEADGSISFVDELMSLLGELMAKYEAVHGKTRSELETGLVLTYALGVLQCDVCAVTDALAKSPVFRSLHPQRLFEECCEEAQALQGPARDGRLHAIEARLRERGWPCSPSE